MRRGAQRTKHKVKGKPPPARKSLKNKGSKVRDLEKRLAEALEQQTATAEVLRVIGASPMDTQPVFDGIARSGVRICGAHSCTLFVLEGDMVRVAATHGVPVERVERFRIQFPMPLSNENDVTQTLHERRVFHLADIEHNPAATPENVEHARLGRYSTRLMVPMLRGDSALGLIAVTHQAPAPFSDQQVALLQTFADQAVIAIENVRLFTELHTSNRHLTEALDQQTATAEILKVISGTPTDAQPVFDTIVRNAGRVCDAVDAVLTLRKDEEMMVGAHWGPIGAIVGMRFPLTRGSVMGRAILDARPIHVVDLPSASEFPEGRELALQWGHRTTLGVPLLREGDALGALLIRRTEVRPFSDAQIAMLKTFADQAVIAIENVRLFRELEARNSDLTEALEQQTATAEILRVISRSQTNVQPVFDTIVANAVRLCRAHIGAVFQFDGELLHLVAHHNFTPEMLAAVGRLHPRPPQRDMVSGRAILSRAVVQIEDILADREYHRSLAFATGWRSMIAVPMLREGEPIGTIVINRREPGPLTEQQIELLKTFADQAVIAIENVRLFTELQQKNEALTAAHAQVSESLEQQTATAEILHVISRSQTDVQPVFDTIVQSAVRLCEARSAVVVRVVDDTLHLVAHANVTPEWVEVARRGYPQPISRDRVGGLAILERRVVHVPDIDADDRFPHAKELARTMGYGSLVFVPMLHEGAPIGAIGLTRNEAFTENQIAMLKTFADQAVIAIENVRLFKELEEKNLALTEAHAQVTEALEQQTATAEILRVISRSQTDVQPVFDTIVRSAVRLCDGFFSALLQFDGELIHHVANYNFTPEALEEAHRVFPARPSRATGSGRAILERSVVHIFDVGVDPEYQHAALYRAVGWRSGLWVPMLREGAPIGVIQVSRAEAGPFSDNEIELLKTFADQAVIAVENVRLFKELQARTGELTQSVEKLAALGEISRAVSSTLDVETVLSTIVSRASQLAGAAGCSIFEYDAAAEQFELRATHNDDTAFVEALRAVPLRKGEGLMGRAAEMREPIQVPDITQPGAYQSSVQDTLIKFGYRALLSVPLLREDQIIGSLSFNRKARGEFPPEVVDVLKTFATQSALAIQNARLFREIADKSAQLEAASRHKSEFLANMSHELRTPLNAIIGFSEVLTERMFGELNDKQDEYLKDIHASGQHLLSLINDILDLSKIEAGRMELERSDFHLPNAIENALILVRERASRRGIRLGSTIDERLGAIGGDERKVKQVLLNLLSNALKFTPEGGRIDVGARLDDHVAEVSVADTGIGIAPTDQEAVFEEFRQVGAADKKAEGTGLGLALSRKFIELHGGKIWVRSEVGRGSTFTFTLPVRS
jgi:GAF domain-containing protein